ncbi:16S rRNA (guanine(527)-N(7))-methyltransferase RsmG [Marinicrinis sediminis]|uniref:Ribosomal RNA small subunit methyltransferase G n=1 Tax=Marinicrinis sediminis TaxID=1652465 RepID=A0ABW5RCS9_9BACL
MDQIQQRFTEWLVPGQIPLTAEQLAQFERYYELLVEWNEKMNLTGITERADVYEKHFYDSLTLAFHVPVQQLESIIDVGSGAGFPGIPLKIAFPHLKLTILDSLNKRISFLTEVSEQLGLDGVTCIHGRAEEWGRNKAHREQYDLACARAVAKLNVLNEFCLPFVKVKGYFAAMKGMHSEEEITQAAHSLKVLGGVVEKQPSLTLPVEQSSRHIVLIQKLKATPNKYPRKPGTPLKQPL